MRTKRASSLFLVAISSLWGMTPLFSPPPHWEWALPQNPSPYIQIGFLGPSSPSSSFRPSINLAVEETPLSLSEYLRTVKKIHLAKPKTSWRNLGKFSMEGGVGALTEISSPGPAGMTKILQAILQRDHKMYLLTAACLQQDAPQLQKELLASLHSLHFVDTLEEALPSLEEKEKYLSLSSALQKGELSWKHFSQEMEEFGTSMGKHWEFLALQTHKEYLPSP